MRLVWVSGAVAVSVSNVAVDHAGHGEGSAAREVWSGMQQNNARQSERPRGGPPSDDSGRLVRLSVNLNVESAATVKEYAERKGITVTEAIRRAIGALHFLDETQAAGASVIVRRGKEQKEVVLLV